MGSGNSNTPTDMLKKEILIKKKLIEKLQTELKKNDKRLINLKTGINTVEKTLDKMSVELNILKMESTKKIPIAKNDKKDYGK